MQITYSLVVHKNQYLRIIKVKNIKIVTEGKRLAVFEFVRFRISGDLELAGLRVKGVWS